MLTKLAPRAAVASFKAVVLARSRRSIVHRQSHVPLLVIKTMVMIAISNSGIS